MVMKPLSMDLRQRIVNAVKNEKMTPKEVATRFAVNLCSVYRFLQLERDRNSLVPAKPTGRPRSITSEQEPILLQQIKDHSDATLAEHAKLWFEVTGTQLGITTMFTSLERLKITRKKKRFTPLNKTQLPV
jgi:transposase